MGTVLIILSHHVHSHLSINQKRDYSHHPLSKGRCTKLQSDCKWLHSLRNQCHCFHPEQKERNIPVYTYNLYVWRFEPCLRCWHPAAPPPASGCTRLQLSGCPPCWASGLASSAAPCASSARTWCSSSWSTGEMQMLYRHRGHVKSPKRKSVVILSSTDFVSFFLI